MEFIASCGQVSNGQQPARIYTSSLWLSKMERNVLAQKLEKKMKKKRNRKRKKYVFKCIIDHE